jgi:tetratricopeptide (TPR) repeat protein
MSRFVSPAIRPARAHVRTCLLGMIVPLLALGSHAHAQDSDALDRGVALYEQKKWAEARAVLLPVAEQHRQNARAAHYLGRAYIEEGQLDRAATWLERATRLEPNDPLHHLHLARVYGAQAQRAGITRRAGLAGKTKTHLERAVALDPDNVDARFGLVQFHAAAPGIVGGNKQKGREQVAEIRRRNAYLGSLAAALLHGADGNWAGAEAEYRDLLTRHADSTSVYMGLANSLVQQSKHDDAFDLFEARLRRSPSDLAALYQVGRLGAVTGLRLDRAEQALRAYIRTGPGPTSPPLAAAHWRLGMILEKQGRTDDARTSFEAALALDPQHAEARRSLGRLKK